MDASCLTSRSNGVFSYVFNHIAGEDESARTSSGYWDVSSYGMWVTDLPTNSYEPLEVSRVVQDTTKKNSNKTEKELELKIAALDQLEAQWDDQEIKIQKSFDLVKEETDKERPNGNLQKVSGQRTGLEIKLFKAGDYFEPQLSPFDDFLQNKEFADQSHGFDNSKDKEVKIQKSADLFKDDNLTPNQRFHEIPDQRQILELKLFKGHF